MGTFDKNLTSKYLELTLIILSQVRTLKPDSELFEGQTVTEKVLTNYLMAIFMTINSINSNQMST